MKQIFSIFILCVSLQTHAQSDSSRYFQKVSSLDSILFNLYDVISGEAGEERNWDLFHYIFAEGAVMIPSGQGKDGIYKHKRMTPDDYVEHSGPILLEKGFIEEEIHREVQQFGNIAHVFSTYHCFSSKSDEEPFMRGINSIQLIYDNQRWWVVNIYWAQESESNPIPKKFGGKKK